MKAVKTKDIFKDLECRQAKKEVKIKDIFKDVEYVQVKKNNKQLMLLESDQINGMSRTELAKLIGSQLGEGVYHLTTKFIGDGKLKVARIAAILTNPNGKKESQAFVLPDLSRVDEKIRLIEEKIQRNSGVDLKTLMEMKEQTFKVQLDWYKEQNIVLRAENEKLKSQLEESGGGNDNLLQQLLPLLLQSFNKTPAT